MVFNHQYSFTGTDTQFVAWFDNGDFSARPVQLETIATISFSVHESKGDVRRLGHKHVVGSVSSIRNIAGTIIFNVVKDHPLIQLIETLPEGYRRPWGFSLDEEDLMYAKGRDAIITEEVPIFNVSSTALPPFNLTAVSATEYIKSREDMFLFTTNNLYNIELIGQGLVISVNNILTEITFTFKASHWDELSVVASSLTEAVQSFGSPGQSSEQHGDILETLELITDGKSLI